MQGWDREGPKHKGPWHTEKLNDLHHLLTHRIKGEVKVLVSPVWFIVTPCTVTRQAPLWNSPGKNTGVGSHSLLQGIFPIQGLSLSLLHCRWILYQLSHQGSSNQGDANFQDIPRSKFWWSMPVPAPSVTKRGIVGALHSEGVLLFCLVAKSSLNLRGLGLSKDLWWAKRIS